MKALRALGLLVIGFVGGVVGVSAYSETPLALMASSGTLADARGSTEAPNCVPDASEQDPIFFLSCGGIY